MRFYNNLFAQSGNLAPYNEARLPMQLSGNVFLKGATPCAQEMAPLLRPQFDPSLDLTEKSDGLFLEIALDGAWATAQRRELVTSDLLSLALIPKLPFQRADASPIRLETDFSGRARNSANPLPRPV